MTNNQKLVAFFVSLIVFSLLFGAIILWLFAGADRKNTEHIKTVNESITECYSRANDLSWCLKNLNN